MNSKLCIFLGTAALVLLGLVHMPQPGTVRGGTMAQATFAVG